MLVRPGWAAPGTILCGAARGPGFDAFGALTAAGMNPAGGPELVVLAPFTAVDGLP